MLLSKKRIAALNLQSFIESKVNSGQLDQILIVVPTNRKLRDLKKKVIGNFEDEPVSRVLIETLTTLTTKLLKENKNFIPLSEAAASVLIKETTDKLDFKYFNKYSKGIPFGTLDRIINIITEYKRHGVSPESIKNEANPLSWSEQQKAEDLAKIYDFYSQRCNELKAFEIGDIYRSLLEVPPEDIKKSFYSLFLNCSDIVLDGFDEFTNPEIRILSLLSDIVDKNVFVSLDYHKENSDIFTHLDNTYSSLLENGFLRVEDQTPAEASSFKNIITKRLFGHSESEPSYAFKEKIFKIISKNRNTEVENIAKTIKLKIEKDTVPPDKICVAFNMVSNYSNIVRDVFRKFEIPINLTDRIPLKSAQPVVAAVSLIDLLENDFYHHDLVRVLSNKFLSFPNIDLNYILFTANNLKITRGLRNWEISVSDGVNLLNHRTDISATEKNKRIESYKLALRNIEKVASILSPLKKLNTKRDFLHFFRKILLELNLPVNILESSTEKEEEFVKSLTVFLQTLEEVLQLVGADDVEKKYPLNFYGDHIRTICNWSRFNVKEKSDQGVLITSINEIRGLKFDYLFLGGMCDGDFPTKYSPEIFNTGSFRKKEMIHQTEERYHFYQTLCCWNKQLYLSIPAGESESELVESTFIKDLEKVIAIEKSEPDFSENLLCKEDLQIAYAKNPDKANLKREFQEKIMDPASASALIEMRKSRINEPFSENSYCGTIANDDSLGKFLSSYAEKQFSISQLETYAKCPFKYFSERILRIVPIDEPSEEIEPIELGTILHSILFEFYSRVVKEKILIGKENTKEFESAKEILFNIAGTKLSELKLSSPLAFFEKEKILGIDGNEENSILYKFLQNEADDETKRAFIPELLEQEFAIEKEVKKSYDEETFDTKKFRLRGKIDRVDMDRENKFFNVIDYKLRGRKPSLNDLKNGLSLQLPVYMIAAKEMLKKMDLEEFNAYKMIIYSLDFSKDNFGPMTINLSSKRNLNYEQICKLNDEQVRLTELSILKYILNIKDGRFYISELDDREEKICRYCDYKSFCRVKEVFGTEV